MSGVLAISMVILSKVKKPMGIAKNAPLFTMIPVTSDGHQDKNEGIRKTE